MASPAIHLQEVTRRFGAITAVDKLSLTVEAGEVFGFLGHNGAGKTTTIRLLNGVLAADSGVIRVLGLDPGAQGPQVRARSGVLTETPSLDERLTAIDNLIYYADLYGVPPGQVGQRTAAVLERFELADRAGEKVGGYSKGMKQRLALARAFLHEPEILFLDEPTAGLDPVAAQEVGRMIRHLSRDEGRTVFLCTHNLVEAQRLCDRVAVMEHGRLAAVGTPRALAREIGAEMRYTLEVAADQREAARHEIALLPAVKHVETADADLTLTLSDREAAPEVLARLLAANLRVYALTPHETSLEDIYMALHRQGQEREQMP
ncbi:MAG: ABC transporter ATP-binding protein [Anaerolineae bacterium]|nr:ABC transporter ATP-binding protein [Anaerolineae bacterium]NUQ05314.1 ABC transporter ATP-binding protein [Anaerolineae bacterium]